MVSDIDPKEVSDRVMGILTGKDTAKAKFEEAVKKVAGIPKCKLEFREGKAVVVCETKEDQKIAYEAVIEGVVIEVRPEKVEKDA